MLHRMTRGALAERGASSRCSIVASCAIEARSLARARCVDKIAVDEGCSRRGGLGIQATAGGGSRAARQCRAPAAFGATRSPVLRPDADVLRLGRAGCRPGVRVSRECRIVSGPRWCSSSVAWTGGRGGCRGTFGSRRSASPGARGDRVQLSRMRASPEQVCAQNRSGKTCEASPTDSI